MSGALQELIAIGISVVAALFLVHKVAGLPRIFGRKKPAAQKNAPILLGSRLSRGLDRAATKR
jgi:hypothetical protein